MGLFGGENTIYQINKRLFTLISIFLFYKAHACNELFYSKQIIDLALTSEQLNRDCNKLSTYLESSANKTFNKLSVIGASVSSGFKNGDYGPVQAFSSATVLNSKIDSFASPHTTSEVSLKKYLENGDQSSMLMALDIFYWDMRKVTDCSSLENLYNAQIYERLWSGPSYIGKIPTQFSSLKCLNEMNALIEKKCTKNCNTFTIDDDFFNDPSLRHPNDDLHPNRLGNDHLAQLMCKQILADLLSSDSN